MMSVRGVLDWNQIDTLLHEGVIGRIGCSANGFMRIVPIVYAYDGRFIYCYSADGEKLNMMRENPSVCFEVDFIDDFVNWRSVIAWGTFEPIEGSDAAEAIAMLSTRLRIVGALQGDNVDVHSYVRRCGESGMAYRIRLIDRGGRFERTDDTETREA
jgi:nitroimidazol reductase NimA-like FMN-containing flavoprotein (pyridoxamine 5'-phosphate oxidase superfamily)